MTVNNVPFEAMFGWVGDTFRLLGRNLKASMVASAVTLGLLVLMFVPLMLSMVPLMMQGAGGVDGTAPMGGLFYTIYFGTLLACMLLFPPAMMGWIRISQDMDHGRPVRALDVLKPYGEKSAWLRGIGFALLAMLMYVVVFGLLAAAFWGTISEMMQQVAAQQAATAAGLPVPAPELPSGFFAAYAVLLLAGLLLQFIYMVGYCEVALRPTPVLQSMGLALGAVLKNAHKLIPFFVLLMLGLVIGLLIFGLVLGLLIAVLAFISPGMSVAVALLLYIPILLLMYPLMFIGHYLVWKSMLGGEDAAPAAEAGDPSLLTV